MILPLVFKFAQKRNILVGTRYRDKHVGAQGRTRSVVVLPTAHPLNASTFGMMGVPNVAAGIYEHQMILVNGLGLALSRRNPNNSAELDPVLYAMHILSICVIGASK